MRRVRYEPEPGTPDAGPAPPAPPVPVAAVAGPAPSQLAEAHHGVGRVLRLALEVLDGRRPHAHLAGHVEAPVLRYWRAAARQRVVRSPARFTRMRLCLPATGVAEVAVACDIDGRVRALAARFEHTSRGWRCTALRLG